MTIDHATKIFYSEVFAIPLEEIEEMSDDEILQGLDERGTTISTLEQALRTPSRATLDAYYKTHGKAWRVVVDPAEYHRVLVSGEGVRGVFATKEHLLDLRTDATLYCRKNKTGVSVGDFPELSIYDWGLRRLLDPKDTVLADIAGCFIFGEDDPECDVIASLSPSLEKKLERQAAVTRRRYETILARSIPPRKEELRAVGLYI